MAIIYSYPSETNIQASDLLVGTSTVEVNGKKSNVTRSYSIQNLTDYIKTLGGLGVESITFSAPLTGGTITTTGTVGITKADGTTDGYLSSADWTNFNSKLGGISGTQDKIPIWTSSSDLGNSSLTETSGGTTITSAKHFVPSAASTYDIGLTGTRWNVGYINTINSTTVNATTVSSTDITLTGVINAAGLGYGSLGEVLVSQGSSAVKWQATSSFGDLYTLQALAKVTGPPDYVPIQLQSDTGGVDSQTNITEGTGISLTWAGGPPTSLTIGVLDNAPASGVTTKFPTSDQVYTWVKGLGINELSAATGDYSMGSNKLTTLAAPVAGTDAATKTYVDNAVANAGTFQGGYDASTDTPCLDGTGGGGCTPSTSIQNGWFWAVQTGGTFFSVTVQPGDLIFANTDNPGTTEGNWTVVESGHDVATDAILGVAKYPTGDDGLSITAGEVTAKVFSASNLTGGYVPDATSHSTKFLKGDGSWTAVNQVGVTEIIAGAGLTGGTLNSGNPTGTFAVDYSGSSNVILSTTHGAKTSVVAGDKMMISDSQAPDADKIKTVALSDLKTYINTGASGTVTSVGLATDNGSGAPMAAFTITNSPVTTSGTLTLGITGGGAGKFLKDNGTWDNVPAAYAWTITGDTGSYAVDTGGTVDIEGGTAITTAATGSTAAPKITINSTVFSGGSNVGHVPDASAASSGDFLDYQGNWSAPAGGGGAPTKQLFTTGGTTYTLSATPLTSNDVLVYVSGVYQSVGDFTFAAGPPAVVTLTSTVPSGTKVEVVSFV